MHPQHIVFDGRVFATEAADRGMGRYVDYLVELAQAAGHRITIVRPDAFASRRPRPGVAEQMCALDDDPLLGTTSLNRFLRDAAADIYVDATPFLPPMRYDVYACPVVAILYDLIPLRFPGAYFGPADDYPLDVYVNGLARVRKADQVVAISRYVGSHALRYLGIPRDKVVVIEPGVSAEYVGFANAPARRCATAR
jgi:glycosyltransferase involved in cell wall biosynthesis